MSQRHIQLATMDALPIALMIECPSALSPNTAATDVLDMFSEENDIPALPIVDDAQHAIGLVTRRKVLAVFAHAYARELNRHKKIDIIMESSPLIFDISTPIETISQAVTQRDTAHAFDPIIFTKNQCYMGLLSVVTLLKAMTDIHIKNAMDCNPLSALPGNHRINREIDGRLQQQEAFTLVYVDLDSFKAFNDCYGYERGDRIIQWTAQLLQSHCQAGDFLGHVGGDDFVLLLSGDYMPPLQAILHQFEQEVVAYYDDDAQQRGFIISKNRQGAEQKFPFISISLAVIPCPPKSYASHIYLSEVASEIKHLAKQQQGNSMVVNRRNHISP